MWLSRQGTCSQTFYTTCDFFRRHTTKNMGNVDPKMGCKIWTPFWGPPNCFFLSRPPKRGPDFRPHFEVHIARFFFAAWRWKRSSPSRMLVSRFVFFTPHCWQCQDMWLSREGTCSQTFYTTCDFFRRHTTKNMGNVDPKMGCKIWTPFWGPPNCLFLSRPPKRGPDFRPHFEVHIARFFFAAWRWKRSSPSRMLVSRFVFFTPHCWNCARTCGCQDKEPAHKHSTQHVIFSGVTLRKTWAMWTLKWGAKFGPRFGVRRIVFSFRGPQNGVQILGPILRSTLPVFFFAAWRWKRSSPSRMLVSRFVFFTPHCWQCQDMWLSREGTCSQTFYTTCDFFRRHTTKNMGNVDPKMGCKIWTPFWGPPNCFFLSRPPKRGPDFRPHFEVHIARFFFAAWRWKRSSKMPTYTPWKT